MFDQLDNTLMKLLEAAPTGVAFDKLKSVQANISFVTPDRTNTPPVPGGVNLFLYETKENRELRNPQPVTQLQSGTSIRRRPPLRVDCAYMVTAWWTDGVSANEIAISSHKLLGQAFNWLSRFPVIPEQYLLAAGMTGQVFAPPTMVAQMDGAKSAGEFWSALGIPPRPYFNLVVTITMDLDQQREDSIVTTISSSYQAGQLASADERVIIGGTVRDKNGNTVADAWVRLEPLNLIQVTDASGRFIFENVMRRGGLTLRARASGYPEAEPRNIEIPSVTGEYDLQFP